MAASLEAQIQKFEQALALMNAEVRRAHEATAAAREERKQIEALLKGDDIKRLVDERVNAVVKKELDRIGPEIREYSSKIYEHVGKEIDKLIDLSLGTHRSKVDVESDLRPKLAAHLKEWIREQLEQADGIAVITYPRGEA